MKVKRLIEELSKMNPEASVKIGHPEFGYPVLFVLRRKDDDRIVWLETPEDCDFKYQLKCRFEEAKTIKESDDSFYTDLLEHDVTVESVREYIGEEEAERMKDYCEKFGLL